MDNRLKIWHGIVNSLLFSAILWAIIGIAIYLIFHFAVLEQLIFG